MMQKVLWLKVRAIEDIGMSTNVPERTEVCMETGFLTISDEKLVEDLIKLLGIGPAKTSKMPGNSSRGRERTSKSCKVKMSSCTGKRRASSST